MYSQHQNTNDAKQLGKQANNLPISHAKVNQSDIFDRFKKSSSTNFYPNHDR